MSACTPSAITLAFEQGFCVSGLMLRTQSVKHKCTGGGGVRAATTAFGAGFGAGSAYGDCQREASWCTLEAHQNRLPVKIQCELSCAV